MEPRLGDMEEVADLDMHRLPVDMAHLLEVTVVDQDMRHRLADTELQVGEGVVCTVMEVAVEDLAMALLSRLMVLPQVAMKVHLVRNLYKVLLTWINSCILSINMKNIIIL